MSAASPDTPPTRTNSNADADQRQALEDAERAASRQQPGSFKDEAIEDKVVEIPPVGPDERPIRGLDPD